jgi:hypothetical protein
MGWIKSSYEDKYLIFKKKNLKVFKIFLVKKNFYPKNKRVVVLIHNSTTAYLIDMEFVAPQALIVFSFFVKMTRGLSINCIHNRKTER